MPDPSFCRATGDPQKKGPDATDLRHGAEPAPASVRSSVCRHDRDAGRAIAEPKAQTDCGTIGRSAPVASRSGRRPLRSLARAAHRDRTGKRAMWTSGRNLVPTSRADELELAQYTALAAKGEPA